MIVILAGRRYLQVSNGAPHASFGALRRSLLHHQILGCKMPLVKSLTERVLDHVRRQELLQAGERVGVAVSGGIDSVALLRLLIELRRELGIVLSVVHFNHMLRGAESDGDQAFVAELARQHDLEFYSDSDDVALHAAEDKISIETAARQVRYGFFRYLLAGDGPQGLKPGSVSATLRGPEGPLFHGDGLRGDGPHSDGVRGDSPQGNGLHGDGSQGDDPHGDGPHSDGSQADDSHGDGPHSDGVRGDRPQGNGLHGDGSQGDGPHGDGAGRSGGGQNDSVIANLHVVAGLDKIVTAHTLDDQAETVLMRIIRGAGMRGLGAIHPRITVEDDEGELSGEIVRPLLAIRHHELEKYLQDLGQPWREDSSNADERFTRNRLRKLVMPLLEKEFNPSTAENLSELAAIARGEEDYWENEVAGWMGTTVLWTEPEWLSAVSETSLVQIAPIGGATATLRSRIENSVCLVMNASVNRMWFLGEPVAVQRRVVKAIGEEAKIPFEFKHVEEILRFAAEAGAASKELSMPLGWKLMREPEALLFVTPDLREPVSLQDYEYELPIPGRVMVGELNSFIEARRVPAQDAAGYNPDQLLDAELLPGLVRVRNWRPGDRFWPAHTKSPKKIKELLQEHQVAQPERRLWPVVMSGQEIVWLRGFASPTSVRAKPGREAVIFVEG
jgi:tRNA(Ile)-lysidine synthase